MAAIPEHWSEVDGQLVRELELGTFREAIAFVDRLADLAEAENHHPDIEIHYRKVTVRWWTHTAGGVTDRDHELAGKTNDLG